MLLLVFLVSVLGFTSWEQLIRITRFFLRAGNWRDGWRTIRCTGRSGNHHVVTGKTPLDHYRIYASFNVFLERCRLVSKKNVEVMSLEIVCKFGIVSAFGCATMPARSLD